MDADLATEEVTGREAIDAVVQHWLIDLHTAMPGVVEAYHPSTNTVDVTPALNRSIPDGAGNWISRRRPKLADVPVAFMHGGGVFQAFPIAAGDEGTLIFCSRNIGLWRANGAQGDAGDLGTHTLDGAVFLPGLASDGNVFKAADGTKYVLGKNGGPLLVMDPAAGWTLTPTMSTIQQLGAALAIGQVIAVAPGTALGVGGTASLVDFSAETGIEVQCIAANPPGGIADICTITLPVGFPVKKPFVAVSQTNTTAWNTPNTGGLVYNRGASSLNTIQINTLTAPIASGTYTINVVIHG